MSTSRTGRSLSERLDRDGAESVLRKAKDLGGDAPETARSLVALQERLDALSAAGRKFAPADEALDQVVGGLTSRLQEGGGTEDLTSWRRPPFPQTDEETTAMGDELSAGEGGEGKPETPKKDEASAKKKEAEPAPTSPKRAGEADKQDSGVVNLKALAQEYFREKSARDAVAAGAAGTGEGAAAGAQPRKKPPMGMFLAVAAGLVAVFGVLLYLFLVRGSETTGEGQPTAGPNVATGSAVMSAEPEPPPVVEAPPPNATAEELERYRREVEDLKARLAQEQTAGTAAVQPSAPTGPAEAVAPAQPGTAAGPRTGPRTGPGRTGPATTGGHAPTTGTQAPPPAPVPAPPPANPLINMLGGGRTTGGSSGTTTGPTRPTATRDAGTAADSGAAAAGSGEEPGGRLAGDLHDLGLTAPPPPPSPPTAPTPPAPVVAPPPPPPPEENLPETLGRPEIRRGTESVKQQVVGCGSGQAGTITVEFTVSGQNGGVTNARVTGEFAGSAVGACAESAARNASFARFRRSTFTFTFPFVLPIQ